MFTSEKSRRKLYSGEYIFDSILRKYYSERKMEETLKELREVDNEGEEIELVKELNPSMDIDRRKSSYGGYYYTITKYKYGGEERKVHLTWRYLKGLKDMKEKICRDLEMMVEKDYLVPRCKHKACTREFNGDWYVFIPYKRVDGTVDYNKSINLDMEAWETLGKHFDEILQGNDPLYMSKRPSIPKTKTAKKQRAKSAPALQLTIPDICKTTDCKASDEASTSSLKETICMTSKTAVEATPSSNTPIKGAVSGAVSITHKQKSTNEFSGRDVGGAGVGPDGEPLSPVLVKEGKVDLEFEPVTVRAYRHKDVTYAGAMAAASDTMGRVTESAEISTPEVTSCTEVSGKQ